MRVGSLMVTVALGACTEPITSSRTQAIIDGEPSPADSAVVGLTRRPTTCEPLPYAIDCTATLIAPRVVLTAAHCLGDQPINALAVFVGEDVAAGGTVVTVRGGAIHPQYDPATHANDIAALILDGDPPASVVPIALATPPVGDLSGSTVRLVGYGLTSPTGIATGVRRMGTATVTEMTATELRVAPGPAMSCHGDSGGPVLAPDGAGGEQLIGVTTWGDPGCVEFGVAIRVDPYAAFLQPILDEAASPAPRRAFDPNESLCATSCEHDSDCPEETVCFAPAGAPRRCTYHGLPQAELGAACTGDSASELCVPVGDSCRQLIACESGGEDDGCGCATSRRGGGTTALSFALVIIGLRRRATRRAARST